jgi:outer membrane protein OmpA-like peptidoglycan-associated protein
MSQQLDWPRYSRWTWIIAVLALIALIWMWMSGRGQTSGNCCGAPVAAVVTTPAAAVVAAPAAVAPAPSPAPVPVPATVPAAAAVPEPAKAAAPASMAVAPAASVGDVQCGDKIAVAANFATGSARLSPAMAKVLGAVVPCIKGPYEVGGHTDNVGGDAPNQALSERRAQVVAGFLASQGVDAKLLSSKGYGETAPISDNATEAGRATNRRIEFKKM